MSRFLEGVFGARGESAEEQAALAQERNAILDQGSKLWRVDLSKFATQIGADESTAAKAMELVAEASTPEQKHSRINVLLAQIGAVLGESIVQRLLNTSGQGLDQQSKIFQEILIGRAGKAVAIAALAVLMLLGPLGQAESVNAAPKAGEPTTVIPAGKDEDAEPIDSENSALPQATTAGKGEGSSSDIQASREFTNTEPVTTTESITSTQSFTLTKYVSATEAVSGTYTLLRKNESITGLDVSVGTRDNATGVPVTVTVEVKAKDGKTFKLGDMSFEDAQALFEPAITSTHTITELLALLPPEWGTVASTANLRKEPSIDSDIVGRLLPTPDYPTRFVALQDGWYQTINGDWVLGELVTEVDSPAGVGGSEVDRKREALVASLSQKTGIDSSLFDLVPSVTTVGQEQDGTITAFVGDRVVATIEFNGDTYVITIGLTGLDIQMLQKDLKEQRQAEVAATNAVTDTTSVESTVSAPAATVAIGQQTMNDKEVVLENDLAKQKIDKLLPAGFAEKYPEATWNSELSVYTRKITKPDGKVLDQVFVPQNGIEGPNFLDDLEKGWSNYTAEAVIATPDFVPGESGFRLIFTVSDEHPIVDDFRFTDVVREDEIKFLNIIKEYIPNNSDGVTLIINLHPDSTDMLEKSFKRSGAYRISDERGPVKFSKSNWFGTLKTDPRVLLLQVVGDTPSYREYFDKNLVEWLPRAIGASLVGEAVLSAPLTDKALLEQLLKGNSDPIAAITAVFGRKIRDNYSSYLFEMSLDPDFAQNMGWK